MLLLLLLTAPILIIGLAMDCAANKTHPCEHCKTWQQGGTLQASNIFAATYVAKSEAEYWQHMREKHAYKGTRQ